MNCSDSWLPQGNFKARRYKAGGVGNWSGHLPFANDLVASIRPDLLVELGTHYGESYFGFCQAVSDNSITCKCYAVDTWLGEQHAGSYDDSVYQEVNGYNELNYGSFSYLLRTTFDEARANFLADSIDLLHIDGLHTYDAVRHDFENWFPAVKPGGIVLLHDITARQSDFGVWRFWEELKECGERFSFLHGWGLGVLRKPGAMTTNPFLASLFLGPEERRRHIQQFYTLCGRNLEYEHFRAHRQDPQDGMTLLQVYPETEDGYSSEVVYERFFKTKVWEHVRLDLLSGTTLGGLRIDITERPGVIDLAGVRVRKATNAECIFEAAGAEQLHALRAGGTMTCLERHEASEFRRFISSGNDPQLYLDLDARLTDQPLTMELWIRTDSDVTILLPLLTKSQEDGPIHSERDEAVPRLEEAEKRLGELEHHSAWQAGKVIEAEKRKNEAQEQLDLLRKELESLAAEYRRSRGEVYVLKRDLAQACESRDKLRAEIDNTNGRFAENSEIQAANDALKSEVARVHAENGDLIGSLRALEQAHSELGTKLDAILSSHSWRLTDPLRRLMEKLRKR